MTISHLRGGVALIGTAAELATVNPVLLQRQLSLETDTGKEKIGDGGTAYNSLSYLPSGSGADLTGYLTADLPDIWTIDDGSGHPVDADAGGYHLFAASWDVVITVGDDLATIQAALDAVLDTPDTNDTVVAAGTWAQLALTFNSPRPSRGFGVYTSAPMTLSGDPVPDPVATHTKVGHGAYTNGPEPYGSFLGRIDIDGQTTFDPAAEDKGASASIERHWGSDGLAETAQNSSGAATDQLTVLGGSQSRVQRQLDAYSTDFQHHAEVVALALALADGSLAEASVATIAGATSVEMRAIEGSGAALVVTVDPVQTDPALKVVDTLGETVFQINADGTTSTPVSSTSAAYHYFASDVTPFQFFAPGVDQAVLYRDMMAGVPIGDGVSLDGDKTTFRLARAGAYLIRVRFDVQPQHGADNLTLNLVNQTNVVVTDAFPTPVALRAGVDENPIFVFTCLVGADSTFQVQATLGGNTAPEEVGDGSVTIIKVA